MSLDDSIEHSTSPSSSRTFESVEVTGVLAVTAFSATMDFDSDWSLSQVANDLHSRLADSAQQLFELDSPVGLCGLDIFKCRFCIIHSSILSCSVIHHIYTAASVQRSGALQKPITEVKADEEEEVKYLIMFDLPSDHTNIVETYVKNNKENLAVARGDRLVREEGKLKAKKGKGEKKDKAGKCHYIVSTNNLRIWFLP